MKDKTPNKETRPFVALHALQVFAIFEFKQKAMIENSDIITHLKIKDVYMSYLTLKKIKIMLFVRPLKLN
jgi:hypothetical protein